MRIAIDAMGGDFAPAEIVAGALVAARKNHEIHVVLVGDEGAIRAHLPADAPENIAIHPASQVVGMGESPSQAVRAKKESSMAVAFQLQKEGAVDATLSAGNTGATMAFALMTLGRIPGIDRPGIATVFPTAKNPLILMDAGANIDCKPAHLADFALMGAAYVPVIRGIIPEERDKFERGALPTVGVLSVGEEESKGNALSKAAFPLVKAGAARGTYRFYGNVEGRDVGQGTVDVIVCDGFVGNVVLKMAEGFARTFLDALRDSLISSLPSKLAAILLRPALRRLKQRFDHTGYGGANLLGINGACIICHGSARSNSVASAIRIAKLAVEIDVSARIREAVASGAVSGETRTKEAHLPGE